MSIALLVTFPSILVVSVGSVARSCISFQILVYCIYPFPPLIFVDFFKDPPFGFIDFRHYFSLTFLVGRVVGNAISKLLFI